MCADDALRSEAPVPGAPADWEYAKHGSRGSQVGVSTVDSVPVRGHACRALLVRTDEYTTNTQAPVHAARAREQPLGAHPEFPWEEEQVRAYEL